MKGHELAVMNVTHGAGAARFPAAVTKVATPFLLARISP
jgi:hypothetical protein